MDDPKGKNMVKYARLILLPLLVLPLSACDFFGGSSTSKEEVLSKIAENELDEEEKATGQTYYKSDLFELHTTIAGYFSYGRKFFIPKDNPDLHVYDNLYLYEGDEFFVAKNKGSNRFGISDFDFCFELLDPSDEQYVDIKVDKIDSRVGSLFIKENKDGVYKVSFDIKTLKIDIDFIKEIDTPRYDYLSHCDATVIKGESKTMKVNPNNEDELMAEGMNIPMYSSLVFDNNIDCYTRVWLDESLVNQVRTFTKRELLHFSVGGIYNLYLNRRTYVVRVELTNPESATYNCYYASEMTNWEKVALTKRSDSNHIFELKNYINYKEDVTYVTVNFLDYEAEDNVSYPYYLTSKSDLITISDSKKSIRLTQKGTFDITVDLLEGTVDAQKVD